MVPSSGTAPREPRLLAFAPLGSSLPNVSRELDPGNQQKSALMMVIKDTVASTFLLRTSCFGAPSCRAVRTLKQLMERTR